MLKSILFAVLALGLACAILSDVEEWQKFKNDNKKLYQSVDEEAHRFQVFQDNLKEIREHNEKYETGETTFKMGVNKFSDLTHEEFKGTYGRNGILPKRPITDEVKPTGKEWSY